MKCLLLPGDHILGENEELWPKLGPLHQLEPFSALGQITWQKVGASLVIFDHDLADFPGFDNELAAEEGTAIFQQFRPTLLLSRVFLASFLLQVFGHTSANHIHRQIVLPAVDLLQELL